MKRHINRLTNQKVLHIVVMSEFWHGRPHLWTRKKIGCEDGSEKESPIAWSRFLMLCRPSDWFECRGSLPISEVEQRRGLVPGWVHIEDSGHVRLAEPRMGGLIWVAGSRWYKLVREMLIFLLSFWSTSQGLPNIQVGLYVLSCCCKMPSPDWFNASRLSMDCCKPRDRLLIAVLSFFFPGLVCFQQV